MVQRLNQIRGQPVGHRQRNRGDAGSHRGVHPPHRQTGVPSARDSRIGFQQRAVRRGVRPGDVVGAGRNALGIEGGDEVVQHVADGDRVDRVVHPLRDRDDREAVTDVAHHLERCRARAEDHCGAQPHQFRAALDGQRLGHLRPTGQVLGQLAVIGVDRHEAAQVDDAAHIRVIGRGGDVAGRGAVGVAEAGLADGVDQVIDDVDRAGAV